MKKSFDPFQSFVKSIITDKVKLRNGGHPADKKPSVDSNQVQQVKEDQEGDLALILAASSSSVNQASEKQLREAKPAFNSGLGYAPSAAELATATQVQRLKNQIRRAQQDKLDSERVEARELQEGVDTKVGMINKKRQGSGGTELKAQMIDENREKRREKKRRQKEKRDGKQEAMKLVRQHQVQITVKDKAQVERPERPATSGLATSAPIVGRTYKKKEVQGDGEQRKFKTKTRSRQKNKRRDTRSEDVKRAKGLIV